MIHGALAEALVAEGIDARLSLGERQTGAALCFHNPVGHDLVDGAGRKLAGAGQRRTKSGLLHQGSVGLPCAELACESRAKQLAMALAGQWERVDFTPPAMEIARKMNARYAGTAWTQRC
jgi:lipoate-protein ligase A